jgi:hypothetical protein
VLTLIFPPVQLLEIVNCPVYEPAVNGANWIVRVAVWPGFRVAGNVIPETEKPVPVIDAALIVTGKVPVAVSVMDCAAVELATILPNGTLVASMLSEPPAVPSCTANVCEWPLAAAVMVADWDVVPQRRWLKRLRCSLLRRPSQKTEP